MPKKKTLTEVPKSEKDQPPGTPLYYEAVGRRKLASARVRLYVTYNENFQLPDNTSPTRGSLIINGKDAGKYFIGEIYKKLYLEPFRTTNTLNRFVTLIKVNGGGINGQLEAIIHGISRALVKVDADKYRPILRKRGFLTRDPRAKQRRKAGFSGKSRARKQSPKR